MADPDHSTALAVRADAVHQVRMQVADEQKKAELIKLLDGAEVPGYEAARQLEDMLGDDFPEFCLSQYKVSRSWKARGVLVGRSIFHIRTSQFAFELAILALSDRSKVVRYNAQFNLAVSQDKQALPELEKALEICNNEIEKSDILACIDAIVSENHNFFWDRSHSGKVFIVVPGVADTTIF